MIDRRFIRRVRFQREIPLRDRYVWELPAIRNTREVELSEAVTFFVGENGSGKSTLLEAIAVNWGFNAEGGSVNFNFSTAETHADFYKGIVLEKSALLPEDGYFLRAESFYNVASQVEKLELNLEGYGGKSLHAQSHGESFLSLALSRFRGRGLYILDEPEAALSAARQLSLLYRLHELVQGGSQVLIATHSPILTAYPGARIYAFSDEGIQPCAYRETDSYRITRSFLENPEKMLRELMEEKHG